MASSTLSGDRRWASARKSMTILGKVPKPINLPSQRLENNGIDPNVEIVPKGTLTWGNRPNSATSNVWTSSALLSPRTDGSTSSPSNYGGRPSSGGSGARPSTAGSDSSQDPSQNAWGSSSRPSTASGLLSSNQTPVTAARPRSAETRPPVTTRPRSADTRPGSSQLSRFAENTAESAVAWGVTRNAEKLGGTPSKDDKFSLSSQDFPTLGSEKKSEPHSQHLRNQQGHSQEHTGVSSGSNEKLGLPPNGDGFVDHENASTLRTERNAYADGGISSNTELPINLKQGHPYKGLKMTSPFDSWHGPPVHSPDRIWYRGGAIGGPYRPSGPLGNFPGDSFAHYPPFPPNSEAVPRPGAGPVLYRPTNGEAYGHQVPHNSFMFPSHPIIPARPGPYEAPVPYDGYYNYIQASYCSSSEHQIHSTGVATRPIAYNQHSKNSGKFGSGEFHNSPGDTRMAEEKFASDTVHISCQGPYKVLLKHSDRVVSHPQEEHNGSSLSTSIQGMQDKPEGSIRKESEISNGSRNKETKKPSINHPDQANLACDAESQPSALVITNLDEISCCTSEGILKREPDAATKVGHSQQRNLVTRKNTLLFEKIEGLNNKIRHADGHSITGELSFAQEKSKQQMVANAKPEHSTKSAHTENVPTTRSIVTPVTVEGSSTNAPKSSDIVVPVPSESSPSNVIDASKLFVDSAVVSGQSEPKDLGLMKSDSFKPNVTGSHFPKRINATQSWGVYDAKSVSATLADAQWTRDSSGRESSVLPFEKAVTEESILLSSSDSLDHKVQRAKLREMAAQRAKQLQEEEEERTREQKAKALAKLEELNRRSAAQSMIQKSNDASSARKSDQQQENYEVVPVPNNAAVNIPDDTLVRSTDAWGSNEVCSKQETSVGLPLKPSALTQETLSLDYTSSVIPSLSVDHETNATALTTQDNSSQTLIVGISKNKQMGYRRRQKVPLVKTSGEKPIIVPNVGSKHQDEVEHQIKQNEERATGGIKETQQNLAEVNASELHSGTSIHNGDTSLQHKKKSSRNSRNKNKDEDFVGSALSFSTHMQENMEYPSESSKIHPAALHTVTSSVPAIIHSENSKNPDLGDDVVPSCQTSSKISEEAQDRMSNQWKPQPSRRSARNQQPNKSMAKIHGSDTVIWAPVKPANKNEQQSEEIIQSGTLKIDSQSSQRIEHNVHNGPRTKRAEMERYVPKPVVKELLQLDSIRKPSVNVSQTTAGDILDKSNLASKGSEVRKFDGSSAGTDYATDIKNEEDNKPSRRGKVHASWRQRSSESILPLQSSNENLHHSDASTKFSNKSSDQFLLGSEQLKYDGWESSSNLVIKEQGIACKPKCQPVYKDAGSNYGPPNHHHSCGGIDEKDALTSPILDTSETDARTSVACENKNACAEHIRPHSLWKPKSQFSSQNQQPSRGNGGQRNFSHVGRRSEKFASPAFGSIPSSNMDKTTQKDTAEVVADKGHQKTMVEIGAFSLDISEELMHAPKPVVPSNTASPDSNAQHENPVSSPPRRHGHRNGRFNRGQEAIYRSKGLMQVSGNSNVRINEDQEKSNAHFEYQPIGLNDKPSDLLLLNSNTDQEAHGRHLPRQRYHRTQARNPGRFIRRNSVAIAHVDDFHNSEE